MTQRKSLTALDLIGDHVRSADGEELGRIEDFIVDPNTGSILYAIIALAGPFGAEDRLYPVPWPLLRWFSVDNYAVFSGDHNLIERAPAFESKHWREMADADWQDRVRDYYDVDPFPPVRERVVVQKELHHRRPPSLLASALGIVLLLALAGFGYMVSTRGWNQAKNNVVNYAQGVAYAARETSEDAALTAKVKTALSLSRRVPAERINVDTENQVVSLHGEMPNEETRSLAEMIARDTPGVQDLQNQLTVNPTATANAELDLMRNRVADLETKYLVHDAMTGNPGLTAQSIEVGVRDATVILSGAVETSDQKYLAEETAKGVEGVRSVNNQLRVKSPASTGEFR